MSGSLNHRISRRSLIGITPFIGSGAALLGGSIARSAQIDISGDCSMEPALTYLYDFVTLNFEKLPIWGSGTLDPDIDWQLVESNELGFLLAPPDWSVHNGYANSFNQDGTPNWMNERVPGPYWSMTAIISPDESAAYIYTKGAIDDVILTGADGATITRESIMGSERRSTNLCVAQQVKDQGDIGLRHWVAGDRYGRNLVLSHGSVVVSSSGGLNHGPGSTFLSNAYIAPARESADLMMDVFLKLVYQQMPEGEGGGLPTPSPTPS